MTGRIADRLWVACWAEGVKLRRSLLPVLTASGICLAPVMSGVMVHALRMSGDASAVLQAKAALFGAAPDVAGYLGLLLTVYAAGGLAMCGIVTAWVFGREFAERTVGDLLALPTPRTAVVTAKFVIVVCWCAVLTGLVLVGGLVVAALLGLPGWSLPVVASAAGRLAVLYGLGVVLVTPVAFVASVGRGYLPAIGVVLLTVVLAQVAAVVGLGGWFPWAVPALAAGVGPGTVGAGSYLLVAATAVAGAVLAVVWWRGAEHR